MNRRGFLRLLGTSLPALVLTRDFRLPVQELAFAPKPIAGATLVDLQQITARMATLLAERLPDGIVAASPSAAPYHLGVDIPVHDRSLARFVPFAHEIPVSRYDRCTLRHHSYVTLPPLSTVGVSEERWLEPAADCLAQSMAFDGVHVTAPLEQPMGIDSAVVTRGGITVRGISNFGHPRELAVTRFDVLYG